MKKALISVSDQTNLIEFVSGLIEAGYEIITVDETQKPLQSLAMESIHLVCVNLNSFKQTLHKDDVQHDEIIANIDVEKASILRYAAKNYRNITVICDFNDYGKVLTEIKESDEVTLQTKERLAAKAFRYLASYDAMIAEYLTAKTNEKYPEKLTITFDKVQELRYGENPHQSAAFYKGVHPAYSIANAKQLHGKALSYNNILDGNAAIEMLKEFEGIPAAVGIKHMNPCGVGLGTTIEEAWDKAYEADRISIFGGIVAFNGTVHASLAEKLSKIFLEIIIAPSFDTEALAILTRKKNIRLMTLDTSLTVTNKQCYENVNDGLLLQDLDEYAIREEDLRCVTNRQPTSDELKQLMFAWKVVKHVKSNAIVLANDNMTVGIGAGQMNRVGAAKIAIEQASEKAFGSVMGSDAFIPMPDTVEEAVEAGITAIIQPGGSIKDQLSIDVCNQHNIAMVYTGVRHFKH